MNTNKLHSVVVMALLLASLGWAERPAQAAELWIGAATTSITPDQPVALDGHRNLRISNKIESPVTATALALESRDGDKVLDQAIMVSCDLVGIRQGILEKVRDQVKPRLPDFEISKLFLNATHTHNAPVTLEGRYTLPESGNMKPAEYVEFMTARVGEAIVESWQKRRPGKVGWGQGQAVVAQNRRAVYADGTAQMYGATNTQDFRGIEGYEDHSLDVLFFWDQQDQLLATAINVPCPSQEAEGRPVDSRRLLAPGPRDAAPAARQGLVRARLGRRRGRSDLAAHVPQGGRSADAQAAGPDGAGGGRPPHRRWLGGGLRRRSQRHPQRRRAAT